MPCITRRSGHGEALEETAEILSDPDALSALEAGLAELERGETVTFAGYALRGKLRGLYSLRVGAYRILYQLTDGGKTVRVAAIRHRSVSYGRPR
jgi:mRNA-degrading endonuclease RelE of RelBE toxin-antitoxin system